MAEIRQKNVFSYKSKPTSTHRFFEDEEEEEDEHTKRFTPIRASVHLFGGDFTRCSRVFFLKVLVQHTSRCNLNSSMSDLVKEEKRDAITVAEDSSSVKAEEKGEKRDDASTIAEDSSSSFSAEIDATTSFIAKKAKELEQTLKLFERQRRI